MTTLNEIDPKNAVRCQHCGVTFDLAAYPDGSPMARALTFQGLCHYCLSLDRAAPCVYCGRGCDRYGSLCEQCGPLPRFDEEDGESLATVDPFADREERPMDRPEFPMVRCAGCGEIYNHDLSLYVRGGARSLSLCSPGCGVQVANDLLQSVLPVLCRDIDYARLHQIRDHYEPLSELDR